MSSDNGTIYGCEPELYASLTNVCITVAPPPCVTDTPDLNYDAACCTSISSYGVSLGDCFSDNAPSCLNTEAATSFIDTMTTAGAVTTGPCDQYFTGNGAEKTTSVGSVSAAATGSSGATPTQTGSGGSETSGVSGDGAAATGTNSNPSSGSRDVVGWKLIGFMFGLALVRFQL